MKLGRGACLVFALIVGVSFTVIIYEVTREVEMETIVDKEAINSNAKSVRIRQGGLTLVEINTAGGILDWHVGLIISAGVLLVLLVCGCCYWKRKCGVTNHHTQELADIEMQQQVAPQMPGQIPEKEEDIDDHHRDDQEEKVPGHPAMLALLQSFD
jgi:hypothetical protein